MRSIPYVVATVTETVDRTQRAHVPWTVGALAFLGFVSLGLPDGLLGVAWPFVRHSLGAPLEGLGALLICVTVGYSLTSWFSGRLIAWLGIGGLLLASCVLTAVSLFGYALAGGWASMLAFGVVAGCGAGAIDAGMNTYAATAFSRRGVTWLHGCYGLGAAIGPLAMTSAIEQGGTWRTGYAAVAVAQVGLSLAFWASLPLWRQPADAPIDEAGLVDKPLDRVAIGASILLFFVYTGIEASVGQWSYSLLHESRGIGMMQAGLWVSAFRAGLMGGRLVLGLIVDRVSPGALVRLSWVGMMVGLAIVTPGWSEHVTGAGLALTGISCATVFPTLIASTPERLGASATRRAVGYQIAAAALGIALVPALAGVIAARWTLELLAPFLLLVGLVMIATHELLVRRSN
jgi:fucose permease